MNCELLKPLRRGRSGLKKSSEREGLFLPNATNTYLYERGKNNETND